MKKASTVILISACLTGLCTRYDGKSKINAPLLQELEGHTWIPVCPEQLGGLATPRDAADLSGGDGHDVLAGRARVITKNGSDVSEQFILGAHQVLYIAQQLKIERAILKARSPSCAVSGTTGVTTALLQEHGITVEER